jgi:HEPN domain-containing protein
MSEYEIGFSEKLTDAAQFIVKDDPKSVDAIRTVLYLSLLSCEISLKALLEKAGMPIKTIRARSHNLKELLNDLGKCKVQVEIGNRYRWVSASRLRSVMINKRYVNSTIGTLVEAECRGASNYPNEIRYGDSLKHYPPEMMLKTAKAIIAWAREHWNTIRYNDFCSQQAAPADRQ